MSPNSPKTSKSHAHPDHLPPEKKVALRKAIRLEWITLAFLASNVVLLYFVMGNSQAMKTAWLDDMLSMIPPIVFLIAERVRMREPTKNFPYGFHRVVSIAFLLASFALFTMGSMLVYDAVTHLATAYRPAIGSMQILGWTGWAGWPMIIAAAYGAGGAAILGHIKAPYGKKLHNKVIHADADMAKADWLVGLSTIAGVFATGLGYWWADAVAALIISVDIVFDGLKNLKRVFADLMDRVPHTVDSDKVEPILGRVQAHVRALPWVKESIVRMHEEGEFLFGQIFVVPSEETGLPQKIERALKEIRHLDWRIRDFSLTPVPELPEHERSVEP